MATFLSSNILIFGPSSVQSLLPVTSISQVETLLEDHRIQDAIELADKQRKKVEGKFVVDPDEVCPTLACSILQTK
jgi:vacuolar protein sorting-associated protein 3